MYVVLNIGVKRKKSPQIVSNFLGAVQFYMQAFLFRIIRSPDGELQVC